jgi:hypothetical protein
LVALLPVDAVILAQILKANQPAQSFFIKQGYGLASHSPDGREADYLIRTKHLAVSAVDVCKGAGGDDAIDGGGGCGGVGANEEGVTVGDAVDVAAEEKRRKKREKATRQKANKAAAAAAAAAATAAVEDPM